MTWKMLSLTQPWASLVALGHKRVETRSWSTTYRGPLGIHAAKGYPRWAREVTEAEHRSGLLPPSMVIPFGAVIALVKLVDVQRTEDCVGRLSEQERRLGDYTPGRFAWFLEDIVPTQVVPARGALGIWEWNCQEPVL